MNVIGSDRSRLLALRVILLPVLFYFVIFSLLIAGNTFSSSKELKSLTSSVVQNPKHILNHSQPPTENSTVFEYREPHLACSETVQVVTPASDRLTKGSTTLTRLPDTAGAETTMITLSNVTNLKENPREKESRKESKTAKTQEETITIMTSNTETATLVSHLKEGSHYSTMARNKSKNLVKLENEKEAKAEQQHHLTNSAFSLTATAASSLPSVTETFFESNDNNSKQQRQLGAHKPSSHRRTRSMDLEDVEASSFLIKAVVGQRLIIPCSNSSLSELASTAKVVTAATRPVSSSTPMPGATRRQNQRFRQPLGRENGNQSSVGSQTRSPANGQGISLIVWHKDDKLNSPIFTADARGASSLREARQQAGSESLRGRAHLEESTKMDSRGFGSTPALVIEEASPEDVGVYTCTIEFHKAPTQTHQAHVELIIPPKNMIIRDDSNQVLASGLVGPYNEDSTLTLTCEVGEPGEPAGTQISWWQLQSISPLSFGAHTISAGTNKQNNKQATQSSQSLLSRLFEGNKVEYLTTMTLESHQAMTSPSSRDFFVALHSSAAQTNDNSLVLPFADGHSLKRWIRVQQTSTTGSERPQSSIQLNLARHNLGDEYLCLAKNNDLSPPLNSSIKINMNLKPNEVKIINKSNYVFKLNQKLVVECQVYGSKPGARVQWFKGSKEVEPVSASGLSDELVVAQNYISEINRDSSPPTISGTATENNTISNSTKISYLTLIPKLSDNQESLICSAHNPSIPNSPPISDSITMNVQFAAQLTLQFGTNIKPDSINLGSDVFMDCNIQSNPPIDDLTWLFNGRPLTTNVSSGIIISKQSLVLQHIKVENRGTYQCTAQNAIGKSESNKLEVKPKFAPVCDYTLTKTRYEVAVNQPVKIDCNVLAEPADDIHFVWQFNQTLSGLNPMLESSSYRVDEVKQYETNFTKSYVIFSPKTKRHYAQFLCSASNSIGKQERPCVISVFPSDLPEPVFGCFTGQVTKSSFSIHCQAHPSSQGRQNYLLELYTTTSSSNSSTNSSLYQDSNFNNTTSTHLKQRQEDPSNESDEEQSDSSGRAYEDQEQQLQVKKMSSESSTFEVSDLKPDTSYNVVIYVQNSKGRSAPFFHQTTTLPATGEMGNENGQIQLFNNKKLSAEASLADRLISYLPKMSDYLSNENSKPFIGIVLLVLLCSISVILLTFFVSRSCENGRKKARKRINSIAPEALNPNKLEVYDNREPHLDRNVQLAPATAARLKGLAGSGSDTSRDTNTESTLISAGRINLNSKFTTDKQQQSQKETDHETTIDRRSTGSNDQGGIKRTNFLRQAPLALSTSRQQGQQQQQQQMLQSLYSTVKRTSALSSPLEADHSNTPQISIQSSSDCTSNNEIQVVDPMDQFYHRDQFLLKCHENISEPVYVISQTTPQNYHNYLNQQQQQQQQQQQLRIINPTGFWPYSDPGEQNGGTSLSGATQVSSIGTGDSFECALSSNTFTGSINNNNGTTCKLIKEPGETITKLPFTFMPASMSIPVSLTDCFQLERQPNQRCLSQELLNGDTCMANTNNGSYLTLAPSDIHQTRCDQQQANCYNQQLDNSRLRYELDKRQTVATITPPANFGSQHTFYCDGEEKTNFNNQIQNHSPYCARTLDDTFRQARTRLGGSVLTTLSDTRRGSFDGSFVERPTNGGSAKHHVKFEQQNNQCNGNDQVDVTHDEFLVHGNVAELTSQRP